LSFFIYFDSLKKKKRCGFFFKIQFGSLKIHGP